MESRFIKHTWPFRKGFRLVCNDDKLPLTQKSVQVPLIIWPSQSNQLKDNARKMYKNSLLLQTYGVYLAAGLPFRVICGVCVLYLVGFYFVVGVICLPFFFLHSVRLNKSTNANLLKLKLGQN